MGRVKRYQSRLNLVIENSEHQRPGVREGVAQVLLNISEDFKDLANDSDCTDDGLKQSLQEVAESALEVEESARSNPKEDGYWHNDFAETELYKVTRKLKDVAVEVGLDDQLTYADEDTPSPFLVDELPDYVDALATDQSGRDIAQFIDTLRLRIRSLLKGRLAPILRPDNASSIKLQDWLTGYVGDNHAKKRAYISYRSIACSVRINPYCS